MKAKCFGIGLLIMVSSVFYGLFTEDWELAVKVLAISALLPLLIAGIMTGALVDGDRSRANAYTEVKEGKDRKNRWLAGLLFMSLPNAGFIVVLFIVTMVRY
ncbi:DUF5316 family protein [Halobacillus dabanensis]|uniref:DUF5316 family protein n=1 Tax=Halobacillus dabanensis TaxID=240302 RepID=UPI001113D37C|nr:DUF5316 family protein [Halobacillus dabanensis]